MLYADDAGIVLRSQSSLAKMMTAIVEVCAAFGLTVVEKKTDTMHMKVKVVAVEAAEKKYGQVDTFVYLGGAINSIGDISPEVRRRTGHAWTCFLKFSKVVTTTRLSHWPTRSVS